MKPEFLVFDNFYKFPDAIRDRALSLRYWHCDRHPTGGNWPGARSAYISDVVPDIFLEFTSNIYNIFGWESDKKVFFETNFQGCTKGDGDSWVHQDVMVQNHTHVGLIYLTPNPEKDSGTILYEPKKDLDPEAFAKNNGDPCHYDIADVAENVFNRCIIYSPDYWHKSNVYFGNNIDNCRLTQVFFFREEGAKTKFSKPLKI